MKPYMVKYNQHVSQIKEGIKSAATRAKAELKLRQFSIVSSSFRRLFPEILEMHSYDSAFIELMWKRRLATLDEIETERVFDIEFTGNTASVIADTKSPRIFAAYHLGSYRAIIGGLAKLGYDFTLIVNGEVYKNQKDRIQQTVIDINKRCNTHSDFEILNAEAYDTAMKMVRHLKKGRSIIAYADGNTGTGGAFRQDEKLLNIQFFNQPIFARQGIAYASFLSNVPIVPVISYRKKETDLILEFFDPIDPNETISRKQYCDSTTKQLFKYLEEKIKLYPLQWEGWLYVHKYLNNLVIASEAPNEVIKNIGVHLINKTENDLVRFNHDRFSLFVMEDNGFLFDRDQYRAFPFEKSVFHFLKSYWNEDDSICNEQISDKVWHALLEQNILQYDMNNYCPV